MPPTALLESLRTIGRKVRLYAVAVGAERFAAAMVGVLAAVVFIDWAAHMTGLAPGGLPGPARLILELAALIVLVFWLFYWIILPALRRHSVANVAGWVEERYPDFGDTLSSTVNFLGSEVPGSQVMKEQVVAQATQRLREADLSDVINPRPLWRNGAMTVGSVVAFFVLALLVGPGFRQVAGSWLLHPLNGEVWPKTVQIALDGSMPQRIAVGEQVPVRVKLTRGDRASRRVIVRYRYEQGAWQEQVMDRGPDGSYTASLDTRLDENQKNASMQIAVEAGDDNLTFSPVTIVPRLDVAGIDAAITSPAYVRAAGQTKVNLIERPAVMAFGSQIDLQLRFNKPLASQAPVELLPTNPNVKLAPIQWDRPAPDTAIAHLPAEQSFRFTVHAVDTDNFRNIGAAEYELIVREDMPPTVQIEEPRRSEERTAVAAFQLKAVAEDDYGIEGAQLVVQRVASGTPTTRPADAKTSDANKWIIDLVKDSAPATAGISWREAGGSVERKRYDLAYDWDLAQLENANLKPGDVLEYFVQVKDNFNLNGKQHDWVPSGKLRITIISQEQLTAAVQGAFEAIHNQLKELRLTQVRNREETGTLRNTTLRKPAFDEADKAQAERIAGQQSNVASQAMQIAQRLADLAQQIQQNRASDSTLQQTANSVQQQIQNTAEGPMKDAAKSINDARDQKPQASSNALRQQQQNRQSNPSASGQRQNAQEQSQQQVGQQQQGQQGQQQNGQTQQTGQQQKDQQSARQGGQQQQGKQQQGQQQQNGQQQGNQQANAQQQNGQQQDGQKQNGQQQNAQQQSGRQQSGQQQSGNQQQGQQNQQKAQPDEQQPSDEQQPEEARERNTAMARATDNQQKAADQIQQAMNRLGNFDGISEFRQKAQEILRKQQELDRQYADKSKGQLGKKPEELSQQKRDEMQKLSDEQKDLARQTQNALEQMGKKADQMQRSDQNSAQAMRQAAQAGNEQQVPGRQNQAAQSMQQNQQADAQAAQQQAELGLQIVISKLADAERRKLEELQAKLAELRQLMDDLVRRQAGHNIDNLLLQGADHLAKMDLPDRQALFDNASRDPKQPQDVRTTRDLNTSQRVTERNTRDVAKKAEQLPDPAPAAKITAAAGHMERAIVHLNNEKLADAYDPPQVDALATLLDARNMVDKALDKIQEQLNQQKKDSIRQAYVKLLDDQKKIGGDIKSIDQKQKDNGALARPDAIRLGQLPGDQGGLADRAGELGDRLQQLDSVVYVWANDDIVKTMKEVKDDLAKPETGTPTQSEETRIEDQLQAMIDSLKVKPRQKEFNERQQRQNQQQQQNQKPQVRMPSEAELQLLKALQQAVNKSTKTIDDQKEKDKSKLLALGGRQGDLRGLLDKMIQKATQGKVKLPPEPDNRDQLPEEAKKGNVEDQELDNQLLNQKLADDQTENDIKLTGDRMARSRQRLALNNDPGKVTQEIQKRIALDLDKLIQQAQNQQAQMRPGQRQPGQQPGQQPQPGDQQRNQQRIAQGQQRGGQTPAQQSVLREGAAPTVDISKEIVENRKEWARLHPRERESVVEGENEKVNPKYLKLVEDYFKSLSEKATEQQK